MAGFMCQLDSTKGCPVSWLNILSGYVSEDVSRSDQHLSW